MLRNTHNSNFLLQNLKQARFVHFHEIHWCPVQKEHSNIFLNPLVNYFRSFFWECNNTEWISYIILNTWSLTWFRRKIISWFRCIFREFNFRFRAHISFVFASSHIHSFTHLHTHLISSFPSDWFQFTRYIATR